jgi:phage-related tail fiber protein
MSAKFFALLTVIGANKLAKATALGTTLKITQMAVGDGGGTLPTPDTQQTKLVGEKRRAGLNTLFVDPKNDSQIIAEQVIPENEGGYWIREIGLFDDEGSLIAVGNCPETYKPQLQEGSGRTQTIRMILTVSHTESVELKVDPSVILATREFVNDAIESASKEILKEVEKNYATKEEVKKKVDKSNVVHEKGASKEKVISQFGMTELFQPKGNYAPAGDYALAGTSYTKTETDKKYQTKGNYADKSSAGSQVFAGSVTAMGSIGTVSPSGDSVGLYINEGNPFISAYINGVWTGEVSVPKRKGTMSLIGDSYTKAESDSRYQSKGNYAPAGNYALAGVSYTKAESDSKYQKQGSYADTSTSTTQSFNAAITSNKDILSISGSVKIGLKAGETDPTIIIDTGNGWRIIKLPDKSGTLAFVGDSYIKSESDNLYQPKGSYQPIGNYALKGESYTKSDSNGRYPLKSDVYSKTATDAKYGLKNTANKSESGWWKCGDTGLIYQWGKISGSTSETDTRNFPIKFPNKCLIMFGSYIGNDWGGGVGCVIKSSSTFLQINHTANASWSGAESNFLAIGY